MQTLQQTSVSGAWLHHHSGVTCMCTHLASYWWEYKNHVIKAYIESCKICAKRKGNYDKWRHWPTGYCKCGKRQNHLLVTSKKYTNSKNGFGRVSVTCCTKGGFGQRSAANMRQSWPKIPSVPSAFPLIEAPQAPGNKSNSGYPSHLWTSKAQVLRWVQLQVRSPHASGIAKNTFGPVGIPLNRGASGTRR